MRTFSLLIALVAPFATTGAQTASVKISTARAVVYRDSITFTFSAESAAEMPAIAPAHRWAGAPLRIWEVLLQPYTPNQTYTLTVRQEWNTPADEQGRPLSAIVRLARIYRGVAMSDCNCVGGMEEPGLIASVVDASIHLVIRGALPVERIAAIMRDTVQFTRWQASGDGRSPSPSRYAVAVEYRAPKLSPNDR